MVFPHLNCGDLSPSATMRTLVNQLGYPILDLYMLFVSLSFILLTFPQLILSGCLLLITLYLIGRVITNWRQKERVDPNDKHVLITGCDTGFGFYLARVLDRKGFHVIATCLFEQGEGYKKLRESGSSRMRVLQLNVTSQESIDNCLDNVNNICKDKGLWAIVNNAVARINMDVELLDMDAYHMMVEVNTFGMVRVCKAFLPLIRKRKGRVLNVTSVRGLIGVPSSSGYITSKFAAEGFSESLRLEMRPFGVKVITIRPGIYGTETGQFLPENVERIKVNAKRLIDKASAEVKTTYGEEYLTSFIKKVPRARVGGGEEPIRRVLDVFESAISCAHPRSTYLIDTVHFKLDIDCLAARLRRLLPAYVTDPLYLYLSPLREEAFIAIDKIKKN